MNRKATSLDGWHNISLHVVSNEHDIFRSYTKPLPYLLKQPIDFALPKSIRRDNQIDLFSNAELLHRPKLRVLQSLCDDPGLLV